MELCRRPTTAPIAVHDPLFISRHKPIKKGSFLLRRRRQTTPQTDDYIDFRSIRAAPIYELSRLPFFNSDGEQLLNDQREVLQQLIVQLWVDRLRLKLAIGQPKKDGRGPLSPSSPPQIFRTTILPCVN